MEGAKYGHLTTRGRKKKSESEQGIKAQQTEAVHGYLLLVVGEQRLKKNKRKMQGRMELLQKDGEGNGHSAAARRKKHRLREEAYDLVPAVLP